MDGTLGKRVLGLLSAAVGRRESAQVLERPESELDVLDQAVDHVAANGAGSSAPDGADGSADAERIDGARRELEAALARIFTSAADAIVTIDAEQRVLMFNHAAEQLF